MPANRTAKAQPYSVISRHYTPPKLKPKPALVLPKPPPSARTALTRPAKFKPKPRPNFIPQRNLHDRLTTVPGAITRLPLPPGSFNAALTKLPGTDRYVCVYRPNEESFAGCLLDPQLKIIHETHRNIVLKNCTDPRLVWIGQKLFLTYSAMDNRVEYIRGGVLMDLDKSQAFLNPDTVRLSPVTNDRQKNWTPFVHNSRVYLIASVKPHIIYELAQDLKTSHQVYETPWLSPWFCPEFFRGNTNPVQLDDGNWLGTFHTVQVSGNMHYYDNGCYVFSGEPPFKVLRCSNRTYLRAEDAIEPHFRKAGHIEVCFPCGMVREGNRLLISYGDNDSAVKILGTTVDDMLATTLEVY